MGIFKKLGAKLPSRQEVFPVFSLIVFIDYSWTLYRMFWQLQSWLYTYNLWDVLIIAAYVLAFALFECAAVLGFLLLISLVFPTKMFKEKFVAQASTLLAFLSFGAVMLQRNIMVLYNLDLKQLVIYPLIVLVVLALLVVGFSYLFERFKGLSRIVNLIADRMTVFSYVYVPISLICWLVVILRNIF